MTANYLIENQFIEVVAAPNFTKAAMESLRLKKMSVYWQLKIKKKINPGLKFHSVDSGLLVQSIDTGEIENKDLIVATEKKPNKEELKNAMFAWKVCKYVKSNAIVYASKNQTLGIGAGQMSRIDSAEIAAKKKQKKQVSI